jgi:hypothetical protein
MASTGTVNEVTTKLPGRHSIVMRLSGREDGSVLRLFARAMWCLTWGATPHETRIFIQEAQEHFGSWEDLLNYCKEWMVVE